MHEILVMFLSALALLFAARKVARKVGLVDKPNARKHHHGNIPVVGGVSIYLSLWILYGLQPSWLPEFGIYMLCASLLLFIGVLDDRFDLPVMPRICLQAGVAVIMMSNGLYLSTLGNILFGTPLILAGFGYLVTLFAVIGAINAFNMVDGIDGLLGSLCCVTFGSLGILFWMGGNPDIAMWCLCLVVACLPFILLNLGIPWGKKFKVFMGDAGSMLIGFTAVWMLIIASQGQDAVMRPVTALWLISVPLMDMLRVMVCRIRRGCSPFRPDREHLHHLLLNAGFSGRATLMMLACGQALSAMTGIILDGCRVPDPWQFGLYLLVFFLFLYSVKSVDRLKLTFERMALKS